MRVACINEAVYFVVLESLYEHFFLLNLFLLHLDQSPIGFDSIYQKSERCFEVDCLVEQFYQIVLVIVAYRGLAQSGSQRVEDFRNVIGGF